MPCPGSPFVNRLRESPSRWAIFGGSMVGALATLTQPRLRGARTFNFGA
jgi:hypothetical protein